MTNLKSTLNYNLTSESLYLKLFQIANQNLNLVQKEEKDFKVRKLPVQLSIVKKK